ncbi:hypothetical protein F2Q69_00059792 [Brassica cretica]|uniref:Uncharacterized protein n=1 Tax=Brassica cretica TaxID=69181 RepID=A0A8S9RQP5_BRACR|nr:hypothetical protein F2Q69_00059792 [Brassica cretica]
MSSRKKTLKIGTSRGSSSEDVHDDDILVPKAFFPILRVRLIRPSSSAEASTYMASFQASHPYWHNLLLCHLVLASLDRSCRWGGVLDSEIWFDYSPQQEVISCHGPGFGRKRRAEQKHR